MYVAYKSSEIFTHLFVKIFVSKFFLTIFNIIIPTQIITAEQPLSALFITMFLSFFKLLSALCSSQVRLLYLFYGFSTFITFSSKLLKYISIAASLLLGLNVECSLNLFRSISFSSFRKCHFKHNILSYASSSILIFALLIWLLVGTNFNPLDNNEISALVSFHVDKLTKFLLTFLPLNRPFK